MMTLKRGKRKAFELDAEADEQKPLVHLYARDFRRRGLHAVDSVFLPLTPDEANAFAEAGREDAKREIRGVLGVVS